MEQNKIITSKDSYHIENTSIPVEIQFLITTILAFEEEIEKNKKAIIKSVEDEKYLDLPRLSAIGYYLSYNEFHNSLKTKLWEKASPEILTQIVSFIPFKSKKEYLGDIIIPPTILPNLKYREFSITNSKVQAARILGAKIIS